MESDPDYLTRLSLDLLIPGLLPPAAGAAPRPRLERWLARADVVREPGGAQAWLARRFGLAGTPVAPVTLAADAGLHPGQWLRADPVFARPERDTLVLHGAAELAITRAEADALVAALQALFGADGLEFLAPHPDRWYVRVPEGEMPDTFPLSEAMGGGAFGLLPKGAGRINWGSAMTEAQMILAAHPVNAGREARRAPPVNMVWFWGGGSLPESLASPYGQVHTDDPFAAGLARIAGIDVAPPLGSLESLGVAQGNVLATLADPGDEVLDALGATAARLGGLRIVLPAREHTTIATITGTARWRIFRARKPLSAYA